jgi:hypothetical protein
MDLTDQILSLRKQGKTKWQIADLLKCSGNLVESTLALRDPAMENESPVRADMDQRREIIRQAKVKHGFKGHHSSYSDLRDLVLRMYGAECVTCGFKDVRALQLDHKLGSGYVQRQKANNLTVLRDAIVDKMQGNDNFQFLCANCNWIKRWEANELPFQVKKTKTGRMSSTQENKAQIPKSIDKS